MKFALCAVVVQVIIVELTTVTPLHEEPPKSISAPFIKPVPVIVTRVPPMIAPELGDTLIIVGAA